MGDLAGTTTEAVDRAHTRQTRAAGTAAEPAASAIWPFAVTIFVSAFLLFQVQLILGKYLLPWFGGTAAVWTTSLLFFQALLFAGYCYAHWLATRIRARTQAAIHSSLLLACAVLLAWLWRVWRAPILPGEWWRRSASGDPALQVLGILLIGAGVPFFVLATTGPLLQAWYHRVRPGRVPYRLYALSNLGSALGLLTYPLLEEPLLGLRTQGRVWAAGFFFFVLFCGLTAWLALKPPVAQLMVKLPDPDLALRPGIRQKLAWLAIAGCASLLMVATSGEICHDLAPLPLLWVAPLFVYLMTFVVCFQSDRWYARKVFAPLLMVAVALAGYALGGGFRIDGLTPIVVYCGTLFAGCMVCHGELARMKPAPGHLTSFYLYVSGGGALGGLFVAMVAPRIFRGYWEYHIALWGCVAVLTLCRLQDGTAIRARARILAYGALAILAAALAATAVLRDHGAVEVTRNFYGVLRVAWDHDFPSLHILELYNGNIVHGAQFMDPDQRDTPAFYGTESGIGVAILHHPRFVDPPPGGFRLGVVGLGSGALAPFVRAGDYIRFYEINPGMVAIARGPRAPFTYLRDSAARIDVVLGDARIALEEELRRRSPQRFDVLAIDAFHSDALPVHLLTREAFAVYLQHLRGPESILAINVTGFHLDVAPVALRLANERGLHAAYYHAGDEQIYQTDWLLLTRDAQLAAKLAEAHGTHFVPGPLWTDDKSDLLRVIRPRNDND